MRRRGSGASCLATSGLNNGYRPARMEQKEECQVVSDEMASEELGGTHDHTSI